MRLLIMGSNLPHAIQQCQIDPSDPKEIRVILEKDIKLRNLSDQEIVLMLQKIKDLDV